MYLDWKGQNENKLKKTYTGVTKWCNKLHEINLHIDSSNNLLDIAWVKL